MKKFIAFAASSSVKSGIVSKDDAHSWAVSQLSTNKDGKMFIAEVIETVERSAPPVEVKTFFVELDKTDAKAA